MIMNKDFNITNEIDFDIVNEITRFQYKKKNSFEYLIHILNATIVKYAYKGRFGFTYITDIPDEINRNAVLEYYLNKGFIITMTPLKSIAYEICIGWSKSEEDNALEDKVYCDWCNGEDRRVSWDEQMRVARGDDD